MTTAGKPRRLTSRQALAADAVATGKTDQEAGDVSGLHRTVVNYHKNNNPVFQARVNRRRAEIWAAAADHARTGLAQALALVGRKIAEGEFEAAVYLIDRLSSSIVPDLSPTGSTDPDELVTKKVMERHERDTLGEIISDADRIAAIGQVDLTVEEEIDE